MTGIFYDSEHKRLVRADTHVIEPHWTFVTHQDGATTYQCRRMMREWLSDEELFGIDWTCVHDAEQARMTA